jgi:NTP pyrophosphatase (non-canonical NTP hydrolase)
MYLRINVVRSLLGEEELLCQLAEECDELAKAALKLRRVLNGKNYTPVTEEQARADILEEIADVKLCLEVLGLNTPTYKHLIDDIWDEKLSRWTSRLSSKGGDA